MKAKNDNELELLPAITVATHLATHLLLQPKKKWF